MAKKSILYVITKSVWGGAGKYVYDLATNMQGDFNIYVAAGGKNILAQRLIEANIPYFEIKSFQRDINIIKEPLAGLEIIRLLFKIKPDIIHANSSKAGGTVGIAIFAYQLLTFRKIKKVFTAHGWAFAEDKPKRKIVLIKLFSKITALFYNTIICVSEYDRQIAISNNIAPAKKLITIHNSIDVKNLNFLSKKEAQKKLIKKVSPFIIGTIAEWHYNKGLFYLLEALKDRWNKENFDIVLIGSGENRDKEKLLNYIKENNIKNVHLHEFIPDAVKYLKAFDIFILPSLKEGLPYVILEAMVAQIPILATNVGGISEMISPINLINTSPKNIPKLKEKIDYLISNLSQSKNSIITNYNKVTNEFNLESMILKTKTNYLSN